MAQGSQGHRVSGVFVILGLVRDVGLRRAVVQKNPYLCSIAV